MLRAPWWQCAIGSRPRLLSNVTRRHRNTVTCSCLSSTLVDDCRKEEQSSNHVHRRDATIAPRPSIPEIRIAAGWTNHRDFEPCASAVGGTHLSRLGSRRIAVSDEHRFSLATKRFHRGRCCCRRLGSVCSGKWSACRPAISYAQVRSSLDSPEPPEDDINLRPAHRSRHRQQLGFSLRRRMWTNFS